MENSPPISSGTTNGKKKPDIRHRRVTSNPELERGERFSLPLDVAEPRCSWLVLLRKDHSTREVRVTGDVKRDCRGVSGSPCGARGKVPPPGRSRAQGTREWPRLPNPGQAREQCASWTQPRWPGARTAFTGLPRGRGGLSTAQRAAPGVG